MASIKITFKTRHRNRKRIDEDAYMLHNVIISYSLDIVFTTFSNSIICFNVYKVDVMQRNSLVADICNKILTDDDFKALNLIGYEIM